MPEMSSHPSFTAKMYFSTVARKNVGIEIQIIDTTDVK